MPAAWVAHKLLLVDGAGDKISVLKAGLENLGFQQRDMKWMQIELLIIAAFIALSTFVLYIAAGLTFTAVVVLKSL